MSEWTKGFISGLIATVIGFLLSIIWEIYKNYRDQKQKDLVINNLILTILKENLQFLADNTTYIERELGLIDQNQSIVINLTHLKNDFWDIIKFNIPRALLEEKMLERFQNISAKIKSINENIISRENYRLSNQAMDNHSKRIKIYDEHIKGENSKLILLIESFLKDFNPQKRV